MSEHTPKNSGMTSVSVHSGAAKEMRKILYYMEIDCDVETQDLFSNFYPHDSRHMETVEELAKAINTIIITVIFPTEPNASELAYASARKLGIKVSNARKTLLGKHKVDIEGNIWHVLTLSQLLSTKYYENFINSKKKGN